MYSQWRRDKHVPSKDGKVRRGAGATRRAPKEPAVAERPPQALCSSSSSSTIGSISHFEVKMKKLKRKSSRTGESQRGDSKEDVLEQRFPGLSLGGTADKKNNPPPRPRVREGRGEHLARRDQARDPQHEEEVVRSRAEPPSRISRTASQASRTTTTTTATTAHEPGGVSQFDPYRVSPGPAVYSLPSYLGRRVPHKRVAGAAVILGRGNPGLGQSRDSPGPCYSPVSLDVYKKKQPQYSISPKDSVDRDSTSSPGPGAYSPQLAGGGYRSKGVSFGRKHSIYRKNLYTSDDLL
ncbi:uncharacterized protein LOC134536028 [Bacillus rossius redtenbacheri]|uniref:uncharacterized protein LOC134536028 n=1 Tax=Bacillus rossius redtenbacheri TaxID=93214 RepID=UPI002FDEA11C